MISRAAVAGNIRLTANRPSTLRRVTTIKHSQMKTYHHYYSRLFFTAVLTGSYFLLVSAEGLRAQALAPAKPAPTVPAVDPATHAAHVAAGKMPATTAPDAGVGDPALNQQLSQLQAKIAQLEAVLAKGVPPMAAAPAGAAMPGMPAADPAASPAMGMGMGKMKPGAAMPGMGAGAAPAPPMAGMSGAAAPAGGAMNMMGMMDKMMGMMDKMMGMGGGAMPAAAPMPGGGGMGMMDMDMMKMGGGAMPAPAPAAPMAGGGGMGMMAMDKMEMAGMMGMSAMPAAAPGAMPQSALPGFPGASHLYHIGATDFFLDHPQHIALATEQQAALNKAREQARLAKSTADRAIQQAEQDLWTLTASDQPDAAKIEGKIAEIGKLTGDKRLAFIHAVGEASKLLTDEQRKILTGFAPPAPAAAMPAGGMKGM